MRAAHDAAYVIRPMTEEAAHTSAGWRYPPPYDLYNPDDDAADHVRHLCDPTNHYHAVYATAAAGRQPAPIGFCCFGRDARVPGGNYDEEALDIGVGLRPDLTGQGLGHAFVGAVMDYARQHDESATLRATIAQFNQRSQRTFLGHGFQLVQRFESATEPSRGFVILTADALSIPRSLPAPSCCDGSSGTHAVTRNAGEARSAGPQPGRC